MTADNIATVVCLSLRSTAFGRDYVDSYKQAMLATAPIEHQKGAHHKWHSIAFCWYTVLVEYCAPLLQRVLLH